VLTQVWPLCLISTSHAREPCRIICHLKENMGVLKIFLCVYIHVHCISYLETTESWYTECIDVFSISYNIKAFLLSPINLFMIKYYLWSCLSFPSFFKFFFNMYHLTWIMCFSYIWIHSLSEIFHFNLSKFQQLMIYAAFFRHRFNYVKFME
jgi:hypothetical protein